jgi:4-hydroxybenzoate polyprenyltransferase
MDTSTSTPASTQFTPPQTLLSTPAVNSPVSYTKGLVFGIISLVLILISFANAWVAFPALVFAILCYVKGQKALGLATIILSILYFLVILGFGLIMTLKLSPEEMKNFGSSAIQSTVGL